MKTEELDYSLPSELIARHPAARREESRLLHLRRAPTGLSHHYFHELPNLLRPDDLLVLNDTRVFPARLIGLRGAARIEALLLEPVGDRVWKALVKPGRRVRAGDRIVFAPGRLEATAGDAEGGERVLYFDCPGDWWATLDAVGHTPLPPYILKARREDNSANDTVEKDEDRERYQTVYAAQAHGSVAAPTAGLHFTPGILDTLHGRGIETQFIRLHVGAGTFQPIRTAEVENHPIHSEYFEVPAAAAEAVNHARAQGRRIVAVGTTTVRALETAALDAGRRAEIFMSAAPNADPALSASPGPVAPLQGWTKLMIVPGFQFGAVDALLTNFHLPRSSLLALVGALAGMEKIRAAYREAIAEQYRFYSYGDCMLIS